MPEKKAQRCDWCRWTTTSRQSSIWISRPSFRWKRQNQQFADGIWTSEHDNISGSHCAVLFFSHKVHDCVEKNFLFSLLNKSQIEMFFFLNNETPWYNCTRPDNWEIDSKSNDPLSLEALFPLSKPKTSQLVFQCYNSLAVWIPSESLALAASLLHIHFPLLTEVARKEVRFPPAKLCESMESAYYSLSALTSC